MYRNLSMTTAGRSDPQNFSNSSILLVNSNWVHPPGQPLEISSKTCPGGLGFDFSKLPRGLGIRQGPGFCGK